LAVLASLLLASFQSLPGDPLYAVKRASEASRLLVRTGPAEASLRLKLADERLREVHGLIARAGLQGFAPRVVGGRDISDPKLAKLIDATLKEAEVQISLASSVLVEAGKDVIALDRLVSVSERGKDLAEDVVEDLPERVQPRVLGTARSLAKIEAEAKVARTTAQSSQPEPCPAAMPTATPADGSVPSPTPAAEAATPTPSPEEAPTPTTTSSASPCASPSPTPAPTEPGPTTTPPADTPAPTPTEQ
jgi:hypothetical protein